MLARSAGPPGDQKGTRTRIRIHKYIQTGGSICTTRRLASFTITIIIVRIVYSYTYHCEYVLILNYESHSSPIVVLNYCIVGCSQTGFSRQELKVPWKDIPVPEGWGRCNARYLCVFVCVWGGGVHVDRVYISCLIWSWGLP